MEILRSEAVFGTNDEVVGLIPRVIKRTRKEHIEEKKYVPKKEKALIDCAREIKLVGSRFQIDAGMASLNHTELAQKYGRYEVKVTFNREDRMYYICIL